MSDQIVITEKNSQARDVRAAVGARYGPVLAAEGHLRAARQRRRVRSCAPLCRRGLQQGNAPCMASLLCPNRKGKDRSATGDVG